MNRTRNRNSVNRRLLLLTPLLFIAAFSSAWLLLPDVRQKELLGTVFRKPSSSQIPELSNNPIRVTSLYDDPEMVTDEQLAAVLKKLLPRFARDRMRPNYVEHAIRIWGDRIVFQNPELISGPQMREFLTDSGAYIESWGHEAKPILESTDSGVSVRWGPDKSTSVHHDHLLASLTEAGVSLDTPVFTPHRRMTFQDVLNQALSDFRLDERETEWSVMAFGFWLAPQGISEWNNGQGRRISFDLLAERILRSHKQQGVCHGTHRVYSLVVLLRLQDEYGQLVRDETQKRIVDYLSSVRDLLTVSQAPDGSWPPNWPAGTDANAPTDPQEQHKGRVISTGHHLEWLAIAPQELHPDSEQIRRAAAWAIHDTIESSQAVIDANYTYYSHVANALALWRGTTPEQFWTEWRQLHPDDEDFAKEHYNAETVSAIRSVGKVY